MKDIYDNFVNQNIAITYIGTGNPFANNSLSILIVDRLPEEITKQMEEADTQHLDLQDIIDKLDLEGKARENGMDWNHFHAISPNRIDHNTPAELEKAKTKYGTKHDVIVWVNGASDQGYGWFTVEDVLEWISHKGTKPISDWDESKKKVKE